MIACVWGGGGAVGGGVGCVRRCLPRRGLKWGGGGGPAGGSWTFVQVPSEEGKGGGRDADAPREMIRRRGAHAVGEPSASTLTLGGGVTKTFKLPSGNHIC